MAGGSLFPRHFTSFWLLAFISIRLALGATAPSLSTELLSIAKALGSKPSAGDVNSVLQTIKEQSHQIDDLTGSVSRVRRTTRASIACDIGKLVFPAKYVDASSSSYTAEVQEPWSETCWLPSACILNVNSTVDTAIALRIITLVGLKFAIRSGGHNPNAGFASVNESGVLVNLGNLNAISVAADHKSVSVGPATRWGDIYAYLDPYGISAIGGRNPPVSVGGLLLGAGMPYIPSMYGLACDNVKSFEVVLANSTVVEANAASNPDLFFALKGGGPNYGKLYLPRIITRVDLHTVPLHQVWYKFNVYNISDYQAVLAATVQTQNAMESDNKAGLVFNANQGVILVGFIYGQWSQEPVVFKPFNSIKPIGVFAPEANGTILSMSAVLDIGSNSSAKREPVAVSHLVDLNLYQELFSQYLQLANYSTDPATDMSFAIQPISAATVAAGVAKGGNPLGIVANKQTWFNSLVDWTRAADDTAAHTAVQKMRSTVKSYAQAKGKLLEYEFMNDASYSQNPLASYGAANLAKLKAVSKKYDPVQVFQTLQNSGFLLSKA